MTNPNSSRVGGITTSLFYACYLLLHEPDGKGGIRTHVKPCKIKVYRLMSAFDLVLWWLTRTFELFISYHSHTSPPVVGGFLLGENG